MKKRQVTLSLEEIAEKKKALYDEIAELDKIGHDAFDFHTKRMAKKLKLDKGELRAAFNSKQDELVKHSRNITRYKTDGISCLVFAPMAATVSALFGQLSLIKIGYGDTERAIVAGIIASAAGVGTGLLAVGTKRQLSMAKKEKSKILEGIAEHKRLEHKPSGMKR